MLIVSEEDDDLQIIRIYRKERKGLLCKTRICERLTFQYQFSSSVISYSCSSRILSGTNESIINVMYNNIMHIYLNVQDTMLAIAMSIVIWFGKYIALFVEHKLILFCSLFYDD